MTSDIRFRHNSFGTFLAVFLPVLALPRVAHAQEWQIKPSDAVALTRSLGSIAAHANGVACLRFSPDGERLATSTILLTSERYGDIKVWSNRGELVGSIRTEYMGHGLAWSPDGRRLTSGGRYNIATWSTSSWESLNPIKISRGVYVGDVDFARDGGAVLSVGDNRNAIVTWDLDAKGGPMDRRNFGDYGGEQIRVSPSGTYVATAGDCGVFVHNAHTGEKIQGWFLLETDSFRALAWSPDSRLIAAAGFSRRSDGGTLRVWDIRSGELRVAVNPQANLYSVAWSPDGKVIVTGNLTGSSVTSPGFLEHRDASNGQVFETVGLSAYARSLEFSPDGTTLAAGLENGKVALFGKP